MRGSLLPAALRYADQVARSGSVQRASKELNVAASAVIRQIALLEENIGTALFERVPRGMRLTPAGDALIALVRRWKADERRVVAEVQQLQGVNQGHVRLAVMDSHVNGFLPSFIADLAVSHPRISLDVTVASPDDVIQSLAVGQADLAAVFNLPPRRDLHILWSAELPFGCVVAPGHDLARRGTTSLQEAVAYPIVLQSRALVIRRFLDAHYNWALEGSRKLVETNSLQLVKQLARSGRYIAFTSELDAAPELEAGELIFLPVRDKAAEPQSVSVAINASAPFSRVTRIVADGLTARVQRALEDARAAGTR
ncbi:LysR family transcriptional regulator [Paracoccus litorisediminis]|uniref:LysR family transcriptional regulator n=1 Tax=Paracoccus litorisediminis TaxID=2006130 RepID=A0A844HSW9_9RHOB|nr:LysR family transcriptional regulator [Paracoccus litorisediminis]MTH61524.1 LysR family transcriptional regulator [Paracoccus litorisediminis]